MARYVDVVALRDALYDADAVTMKGVAIINQFPTADVVAPVRCKDCNVPHNKWLGCPNLNGMIPPPDFYCARGERRKDG